MARIPLVAGNWKMNTTLEEGRALAVAIKSGADAVQGIEIAVAPPFISLAAVVEAVRGSMIAVGAQNMHHEEKGAFTGEISPLMLQGLCRYVILGHSERRAIFREQDADIAKKVSSALAHGFAPILCVGENREQREDGQAGDVVKSQLHEALYSVSFDPALVIAYEPVWAIGTGLAATGETAQEMCALIRDRLATRYAASNADQVRVLYGGSVTAANVNEFASQADVDGALVGGASLRAEEFLAIVRETAAAKG